MVYTSANSRSKRRERPIFPEMGGGFPPGLLSPSVCAPQETIATLQRVPFSPNPPPPQGSRDPARDRQALEAVPSFRPIKAENGAPLSSPLTEVPRHPGCSLFGKQSPRHCRAGPELQLGWPEGQLLSNGGTTTVWVGVVGTGGRSWSRSWC